ncbi:hypothetical protein A2Z33_01075 [Candidatus Gottesmanbacteria bacterium RBG_16_52_11]|uniref:Uncharacterized protein n=1 Tax=Candidatus Gottesmanbacteria bacterium RBG_16_52_11 TaxID=1798374 RepID=A0A1F5YPB4_9BACT|nr:MAG: hypothetical protein A2Z33_01075 [Candidatus Gottesmanbacteria bacterium RBG_16_52_11]
MTEDFSLLAVWLQFFCIWRFDTVPCFYRKTVIKPGMDTRVQPDDGSAPEAVPVGTDPGNVIDDSNSGISGISPGRSMKRSGEFGFFLDRQKRKYFGTRRRSVMTLSGLATIAFFGIIGSILFVFLLFAWYAKDLPRPDKVKRVEGLSTVLLDRNGKDIFDIYQDVNRKAVKWEDVPEYCREATVAIEDKEFYRHPGLSTTGIVRAAVNIFVFRNFQGGSTLTQQLVKNVLLTQERTLPRKIKEAILAVQIERKYTKDEILHMYLNETPYGGTAVGAEAAAEKYFGKALKEMGLTECAFISGLAQAPSRYSPFTGEPKAYVWRTEQVLRRMREDGYITKDQEELAAGQLPDMKFSNDEVGLKAPHFVAFVNDLLVKKFGSDVVEQGLRVTTTLDMELQDKVQKIVAEEVDKAAKLKVSNGAAVVIDPKTGEILVMVGSRDYQASDSGGYKYNVVTQGLRQPGSAIKPFTYATALRKGYTADMVLTDVETKYPSGEAGKPDYSPKNYDGKYRGPIQMRYALGNSINTIAVKTTAIVGIREGLRTAYDAGLSTLESTDANLKRFGLSITLGGGEVTLLDLTSGFGVFAAGGQRQEPVALLKVENAAGKTIYEYKPGSGKQVISADIAYIITHILSDNDARKLIFGERSLLTIPGRSVAVKTGTTDDKRDNWTIGYTRSFAVGAWVGNNDNSPMHPSLASGITGAAPIWNRIMRAVTEGKKDEPFERPGSVIEADVDGFAGGLPVDGQPTRKELFVKGTEPAALSPIYKKIKVSKRDSNRLANAVQILKGEYDEKLFVVIREDDPVSSDGKNRWQEPIDNWVNGQADAKFHPPTQEDNESDKLTVRIVTPKDKETVGNNFTLRAEIGSMEEIRKIEIFLDGKLEKESKDKELTVDLYAADGSHSVRIRAEDTKGNTADAEAKIGVNEPYATPTPESSPTLTPTPSTGVIESP